MGTLGIKPISASGTFMRLLFGISIVLYLISSYAPFFHPQLKYFKYILPFIQLLFLVFIRRVIIIRPLLNYFLQNFILYLFVFLVSFLVVLYSGLYPRFFIEIFLVFSPLLFAFGLSFLYTYEKKVFFVRIAFWGTVGTYILEKGNYFFAILLHPSLLIDAIRTSTIDTESGLSFIFGLFFLYYMMERDKKYFWLSLLFCVISFKRISLIGIIACFLFWFLFKNKQETIRRAKAFVSLLLLLSNLLIISVFFQLISGDYDEFIKHYTGLSPNQFLMGRYDLYMSVMSFIGDIKAFGIGFGKIADILSSHDSVLLNFHSDILRTFLELGPFMFSLWFFYFMYYNLKSAKLFVLALYLNILFLSDNVLIYFEVMFFFYFFAIIYITQLHNPIIGRSPQEKDSQQTPLG